VEIRDDRVYEPYGVSAPLAWRVRSGLSAAPGGCRVVLVERRECFFDSGPVGDEGARSGKSEAALLG
jgi:hypothetical protein